ncbi:MAG: hypothetical protein EXR69_10050 [Myxococcales bacterium]|nr:hypothetical protein [Myxococcales bacterium]
MPAVLWLTALRGARSCTLTSYDALVPHAPGSRLIGAAAKPLNLLPVALGGITATGLLLGGLPPLAVAVGAISFGAWAALVAWDLVSVPKAEATPRPVVSSLSPRLQAHLDSLNAVGASVRERIKGHEGVLTPSLVELNAECQHLIDAATGAAKRGDAVLAMLAGVDRDELRLERDLRAREARAATDAEVRRSLTAASEAKTREIETWQSLATLASRISAELVAADAAMDEINVRVARMTLDDPGSADAGGQLRDQIKGVASRLYTLERAAQATLEEVR